MKNVYEIILFCCQSCDELACTLKQGILIELQGILFLQDKDFICTVIPARVRSISKSYVSKNTCVRTQQKS